MNTFSKIINIIGGRKLVLTMLIFVTSIILLLVGKIADTEFSELLKVLLIAYPASNVAQHVLIKKPKDLLSELPITDMSVGRKFMMNLVVYIVIVTLVGVGAINSDVYISITTWLMSMYATSNVTSKLKV